MNEAYNHRYLQKSRKYETDYFFNRNNKTAKRKPKIFVPVPIPLIAIGSNVIDLKGELVFQNKEKEKKSIILNFYEII